MTLRLAIVNDYEVVVRGLGAMLAAYDAIEVVELDAQQSVASAVDVALYDTFAQTQGDQQEVANLLANPLVGRVVVYTWNLDAQLIEATMQAGVSAYLSKALSSDDLVAALQAVADGEQVIIHAAAGENPGAPSQWPGKGQGLTAREAEVLALITQGLSNNDIADRASLSINSVKTYIRSTYRKIGVESRTQAVLWGIEHGFAPDRGRYRPPAS